MKFKVNGIVRLGEEFRVFTKVIDADSEKHAKDVVVSLLGSQYGARRTEVQIKELKRIEE